MKLAPMIELDLNSGKRERKERRKSASFQPW